MCILFLYVAKESSNSKSTSTLKFLLASNRDEYYARPTNYAKFWDSDPNILAGQDCQELGTWLGVSKTGKLAVLLNIISKASDVKLKSRGDLVTGFLKSDPTVRGLTYCNNLHQAVEFDIRKHYEKFNLVTVDLNSPSTPQRQSSFDVTYLTNSTPNPPIVVTENNDSNIFAFGNSDYNSPFCKVATGRKQFDSIIQQHADSSLTSENRANLKEQVLGLLKNPTRYFPDAQMESQALSAGHPLESVPELSSIFVTSDKALYGTRTHTIIMVDSEDNVNFHEWTRKEPINTIDPEWIESQYTFTLQDM